ncbi:MAG: adenine deaminase C-terminal domain-containing protein [Bacillota bacterium]
MEIIEAHVGTKHRIMELPVEDGIRQLADDVLKVMVVERHGVNGTNGIGLVKGFGIKAEAVASTVAHDSHNLLIMGTNDRDMAYAGNVLAEHGGGMVAVMDEKILALLPLPIAGLMSPKPVEEVQDLNHVLNKFRRYHMVTTHGSDR